MVKRKSGRRWIVEKANIPFSVKQKPRFSFPLLAALLRSLIDYAASWQMMIMILKLLVVKMIMVSMNISLMNKLTSLKARHAQSFAYPPKEKPTNAECGATIFNQILFADS